MTKRKNEMTGSEKSFGMDVLKNRKVKCPVLPVIVAMFYLLNAHSSMAQKGGGASNPGYGIGLRLGDPLGISFKKYMGSNALELNIGRSYLFHARGWYGKRFDDWYGKKKFGYNEFQYQGYTANAPLSIQLHYLFQKNIKSVENLQWYWGIGGQFRYQKYYFDYRYKVAGDNKWYYAYGERVTNIDLGLDGVLGLEYTFADLPISLFGDMNLFLEVADNPFALWFQAGIGGRFNF
jgi:hypothetical protein